MKISYDYPKQLVDENGYPTPESLEYIKNWSIFVDYLGKGITKTGQFWKEDMFDELISYIEQLWWGDGINYEDGLLELHTGGWSGNEDIIEELRNTNLWWLKFRCEQVGGHYFFQIDHESNFNWHVVKYRKTEQKKYERHII